MTLESTHHSQLRLQQRGLTKRQLQAALKHGGQDARPGRDGKLILEYDGTTLVTDETRKVAITAYPVHNPTSQARFSQPSEDPGMIAKSRTKLQKKLRGIEILEARQKNSNVKLEANQLSKVASKPALLEQLRVLEYHTPMHMFTP